MIWRSVIGSPQFAPVPWFLLRADLAENFISPRSAGPIRSFPSQTICALLLVWIYWSLLFNHFDRYDVRGCRQREPTLKGLMVPKRTLDGNASSPLISDLLYPKTLNCRFAITGVVEKLMQVITSKRLLNKGTIFNCDCTKMGLKTKYLLENKPMKNKMRKLTVWFVPSGWAFVWVWCA